MEKELQPKYSNIKVQLDVLNGNAFSILGAVARALKKEKISGEEIQKFQKEATSGDYNHLLQTCMKWVNCGTYTKNNFEDDFEDDYNDCNFDEECEEDDFEDDYDDCNFDEYFSEE